MDFRRRLRYRLRVCFVVPVEVGQAGDGAMTYPDTPLQKHLASIRACPDARWRRCSRVRRRQCLVRTTVLSFRGELKQPWN